MTVTIKIKNATFSKIVASNVPQQTGLRAWAYVGGSATKSTLEYAVGGGALSVVGALTFNTFDMSASFGNCIGTNLLMTPEVSFVALFKKATTVAMNNGIITNYYSVGTPVHDSLVQANNSAIRMYGTHDSNSAAMATLTTSEVTAGNYLLACGCVTATGLSLRKVVGGAVVAATPLALTGRNTGSIRPYAIGSQAAGTNTFGGAADTAFAGIWSRALSDADLLEVYAWLKARYAGVLTIA